MGIQTASIKARTALANMFGTEYRKYYLEEVENHKVREGLTTKERNNRYAKAASKARTRLTHKYPEVYRQLYEEARQQGYPANLYYQ